MSPEARVVDRFLGRVRMRLALLFAVRGAAIGLLLVPVLGFVGVTSTAVLVVAAGLTTAAITALGSEWRWGWWRSLPNLARLVERRTKAGHNLLVTAAELPRDSSSYVNDAVMTRAARIAGAIDTSAVFPARSGILMLIASVVLALATWPLPVDEMPIAEPRFDGSGELRVRGVTVRVTPPAYSGLPAQAFQNPSVLEVLASSTIDIIVDANASAVRLETLAGTRDLPFSAGHFQGRITALTDGFLALEPRDSAGNSGSRRLVGLTVREDRPPRVTLSSPGRDLFFSTVPNAVDVRVTADDDLALDSLHLRYTAVSGSGERFTFVERTVPLTVSAASPRNWAARGSWPLDQLALEPGDLVVYRAVARDRRPGALPVESESYVIEVVTPGAIASEGFAADDQRDRYAVSQQMVILKTERLIARRGSAPADSVHEAARLLAAEQRQVRAEFVFMMGGEVEDHGAETEGTTEVNEVAEAEAEGDILAGRLANQGRIEMLRAIRAMSRASAALTDIDLDRALRDERTALDNLMRAFSRSRFILRALTQRERIDLERRLSGTLNAPAGLSGPATETVEDPRAASLRTFLAAIASLSTTDSAGARSRVSSAALGVVRADPGSNELRQLVTRAQGLAQSSGRISPPAVDSLVRHASAMLAAMMPLAPNVSADLASDAIAGQLGDAKRRPGGRQ